MKKINLFKFKGIAVIALSMIMLFSVIQVISLSVKTDASASTAALPLYTVSGRESSVRYGTHEVYAQDKSGIVVKLAPGEKFRFEKAIDFNGKTATDVLLSLFPTPQLEKCSDAHFLSFTFTDVYDENNYFTVTCWDPWKDGWGAEHFYMKAAPVGRVTAGKSSLNGAISKGEEYGTEALVSFSGQNGTAAVGDRQIYISMDYSNLQLFGTQYNIPKPLVCDFDDTDYFDEPWEGFSSGEAFLTIEAANYNTTTFDFVITEICGEDLSKEAFVPECKPEIQIDMVDSDNRITTLVGKGFKIPECSVKSVYDDKVTVAYEVYCGSQKIEVTGESFVPTKIGEYKIVYTATDKYGNSKSKEITVNAINGDSVYPVLFERNTSFKTGAQSVLAKSLYFGGLVVGEPSVEITATLIGGEKTYKINSETLEFCPEYPGEYVIRCEYFDYISGGSEIYKVVSIDEGKAYIYDTPNLPDYFIKNAKYTLPQIQACAYIDGAPSVRATEIFVSEDGGSEKRVESVYKVQANDVVKVIYRYGNGELKAEKVAEVKVIDVGYGGSLIAENYFVATKGEITRTADDNGVYFSSANDFSFDFINTVQAESFALELGATGSMKEVVVTVTDSLNPAETISLKFRLGVVTTLYVNGSPYGYRLSTSMLGGIAKISYSNADKTIKVGGKTVNVKTRANGERFNGFSSSIVKFSVAANGIHGTAGISLQKINNQAFYDFSADGDLVRPELIVNVMRGDRRIGEKIKVYSAVVKDVLDPYTECKLSVLKPDGSTYVTAVDGTELKAVSGCGSEYEFLLEENGSYLTVYEVRDGYGNKVSFGAQNVVTDMDEPILTIKQDLASQVNVGKEVKLPEAEATDNGKDLTVYVYVEAPNSNIYRFYAGDSFKANIKGVYKVTYYAVDDSGNMAAQTFKITAK